MVVDVNGQGIPETVQEKKIAQDSPKFDYDQFHEKTKFGPLDIPFHWAQVLKIVDILTDCRARWLIHEVFSLQLNHVLHHIYFKAN